MPQLSASEIFNRTIGGDSGNPRSVSYLEGDTSLWVYGCSHVLQYIQSRNHPVFFLDIYIHIFFIFFCCCFFSLSSSRSANPFPMVFASVRSLKNKLVFTRKHVPEGAVYCKLKGYHEVQDQNCGSLEWLYWIVASSLRKSVAVLLHTFDCDY